MRFARLAPGERRPAQQTGNWLLASQEPPLWLPGYHSSSRGWSVECTLVWSGRNRWMIRDREVLPATTAAWVSLSLVRVVRNHPAHESVQPASPSRRSA